MNRTLVIESGEKVMDSAHEIPKGLDREVEQSSKESNSGENRKLLFLPCCIVT